ncbi:MAG: ATP-binding cassette domain-containing protein [Bacilli bacterium]|nr:ATP-binding cassette domain-containing protein [Bacilli bacterium]
MAIVFDDVTYYDEIYDASFNIESGKITGIVGSSNSGKSTIVDLISGLIYPEDDSIIYDDVRTDNIGVLFQDINDQFFYDSIIKDFYLILKRHHIKNAEKKMVDSLKMVGLDSSYLYLSPFELSHSEQKKVSLALILSFNPKVIVLDEPFLGLDYKDKMCFINLIRMMKIRYGKTIVVASRDTNIIHSFADSVILLNEGRVIKTGDKYEVLSDNKLLNKCNLSVPDIIGFSNLVRDKKGINIGYRDDINDLAKDIYRNLR